MKYPMDHFIKKKNISIMQQLFSCRIYTIKKIICNGITVQSSLLVYIIVSFGQCARSFFRQPVKGQSHKRVRDTTGLQHRERSLRCPVSFELGANRGLVPLRILNWPQALPRLSAARFYITGRGTFFKLLTTASTSSTID